MLLSVKSVANHESSQEQAFIFRKETYLNPRKIWQVPFLVFRAASSRLEDGRDRSKRRGPEGTGGKQGGR